MKNEGRYDVDSFDNVQTTNGCGTALLLIGILVAIIILSIYFN